MITLWLKEVRLSGWPVVIDLRCFGPSLCAVTPRR